LVGPARTDDRRAKCEIAVSGIYSHARRQRGNYVEVSIASYILERQTVLQIEYRYVCHSDKVLIPSVAQNEDTIRRAAGTRLFFSQNDIKISITVEVACVDGSLAASVERYHYCWAERPIPQIQRRTGVVQRIV